MADYENPLAGTSPLARALRMAMSPDDLRNPLMHPGEVNQFALPPKEPRAELRNLPTRPGDYLAPVSEALSPTMGAYGLGNALGDVYVKGREGDYVGAMPSLAEVLLGMAPIPGMKKGTMPPRVENPIKAYHGSPHDFDKFDLSKIGTGEGAQAYGHGLYFSEHPEVARSYREALTGNHAGDQFIPSVDGKMVHDASPTLRAILQRYRAPEAFIEAMQPRLAQAEKKAATASKIDEGLGISEHEIAMMDVEAIRRQIDEARGYIGKKLEMSPPGRTYEVAIHATPDQFLDWDKPLSQQSEAVRSALAPLISDMPAASTKAEKTYWPSNDPVGRDLYEKILHQDAVRSGREPNASDISSGRSKIEETGIPGIRYLDQGSRADGKGTSNFVVFDPNLIEILRKYGLLGPVALGATANALGQGGDQ